MNQPNSKQIQTILIAAITAFSLTAALSGSSAAQREIIWQGHTWNITNGGMAGVAPGNPKNVFLDSHGYLHLNIKSRDGKWSASELFTADNLGFGTYQWVVEGDVWNMDPVAVLGLFPYGPEHGIGKDGSNEIDIEFSQWDNTCDCDADFTIYPSVRRKNGHSSFNRDFTISDGTRLTTARMMWSSTSVVFILMSGDQPIGTTANVLKTSTYKSSNTANIPQQPLPVGINFWAFTADPATNQTAVIRSFQYIP